MKPLLCERRSRAGENLRKRRRGRDVEEEAGDDLDEVVAFEDRELLPAEEEVVEGGVRAAQDEGVDLHVEGGGELLQRRAVFKGIGGDDGVGGDLDGGQQLALLERTFLNMGNA